MDSGPCEKTVEIVNARGLHARAAAKFVQEAERFSAEVTVNREDLSAGARSIMSLLMLGAGRGSRLRLRAEGPGAEGALAALAALVEGGFGEEA